MDPITILLGIGSKVIDKIWPDETQANAAKLELMKMQMSGELAQMAGQLEINEKEAENPSVFVSGWRPFIGWVCGGACAWNWVGLPVAKLFLPLVLHVTIDLKAADLTEMMPVLFGMLGLGGLRTMEKINGVDRK
jgi:hypothetical protein